MVRISEFTGLIVGFTFFLGTLFAAQAFISHDNPQRAELVRGARMRGPAAGQPRLQSSLPSSLSSE